MPFGAFPPSARRRVVVTGIGLITPVGLSTATTWEAVCTARTGTTSLAEVPYFLPTVIDSSGTGKRSHPATASTEADGLLAQRRQRIMDAMPCKVAAPVRDGSTADTQFAPTAHAPRSFRFAARAVDEALRDAQLLSPSVLSTPSPTDSASTASVSDSSAGSTTLVGVDVERIGVNIGVGIPSIPDVTDVALNLFADPAHVRYGRINPFFVPKILGNMAAADSAIRYNVRGPIGSSVAACATGAHCIGEAAEWVRSGRADVMICGATEACITPISIAGFARMRALCTKYNETPEGASRPFDVTRSGFVMGEGAGVLILEDLDHAKARGVRHVYGELRGLGISSDAYHVAAPHPDGRGAKHCISEALRDGGDVPVETVGYVNAHATGTVGDEVELSALHAALLSPPRKSPLYVSSSKGALGHLLGAAGSVEAAIALLALDRQLAPPTANLMTPCVTQEQLDAGMALVQGRSAVPLQSCEAVVSTSFGFGGVNTALLFTRVDT